MPMLNGMGLSGLSFVGADIGGIMPVPSPELYTRWMQTGLLTPFAWTHSLGPGNLEPWGFGNRMEAINRESIKLRYRFSRTFTPHSGRRRRPASRSCAR